MAPIGVHMVGSVPLANTEAVLRECTKAQPQRLKRVTDGEVRVLMRVDL